jgi:2'-5' RNA ligase
VRRDYAQSTFRQGIPFHVTLLYPFAPRDELTEGVLATTRDLFAAHAPFDFTLTRIATWPDVVYAVPEPDAALRALMAAVFAQFPHWPPYGGIHPKVIPHATLGEEVDAASVVAEIEHRVNPHLPHRCQARDVSLLEEYEPDRWGERERFPLGG